MEYCDVSLDSEKLDDMLKLTSGMRKVPIIIEDGKVIIGFNGRA